ncbi:methyl-accepting chemotaxis protein [Paucibacter sp. R3-3]|uniref:Methyl-accepting chemotaxis protein n=1 Tax=Roseateles agri TaxID=3098619 RepID=A0ABU5DGC3_9BURK|nr:methyl-accepting chemotaxis protein [Paucibacter sp. R3-3]MDY0745331.1 methyl-accepting chemotaxis protein [Paucibacter sp. R3-3]
MMLVLIASALAALAVGQHYGSTGLAAIVAAVLVALHIQLGRGTIELHFGVFVLLGLLLVYRDWRVIVGAAAFFAVHHLAFDRLQAAGMAVYCTPDPDLLRVVMHAAYVVLQTAAEVVLAIGLERAAREAAELVAMVRAVDNDDTINLSIERLPATTATTGALRTVMKRIAGSIDHVGQAAETIATASSQIAMGNVNLSHRTEEQASALQETAATMDQLSTTVQNTAQNARQASDLAHAAADVADRGRAVVDQVVETMHGIDDSSRRIGDIIGVIDGIAFQTNILALNAAVESARAGEMGRGFAVVAGEVRALAQRSAQAAKEIKQLIARNVEQVQAGGEFVGQAGLTMADIVSSIKRVNAIVGEISAATSEQSAGIQQVGIAIGRMDEATQHNAALVEESAAATDSLKAQAQRLMQAMSVFETKETIVPTKKGARDSRPGLESILADGGDNRYALRLATSMPG